LKIEIRGNSLNAIVPHSPLSSPANGSAEWPPDDRLRRAIQYSEAPVIESRSRSVLDTPLSRSMTVLNGAAARWIVSRSLSSGAHSRDPLASRNDEWGNRFSDNGDVTIGAVGLH
jgi:hypothetical protein